MPAISSLAIDFGSNPLPTLLIDTCSVLDVVQAPTRMGSGAFKAFLQVLDSLSQPTPGCRVVTSSIIGAEFRNNLVAVSNDCNKALNLLIEQNEILSSLSLRGATAYTPPPITVPDKLSMLTFFESAARSLLARAVEIDSEGDMALAAYARMLARRPPVLEKDRGAKDALILEEYLKLGTLTPGRAYPIVFISSNIKDFGRPGRGNPVTDELVAVNIEHVMTWDFVVTKLGI